MIERQEHPSTIIMVVAAVSTASRILTRARRAAPWSDRHLSLPVARGSVATSSSRRDRREESSLCVRGGRRRGNRADSVLVSAQQGKSGPLTMDDVKKFGKTGTVAYVVTELAFWAVAFPLAYFGYRFADGAWLDLSDPGDKAKLFGAGAVFINGVRLLVPVRLAAALALARYWTRDDDDDDGSER